jgi:hypothetical protein
MGNNGNGKYDNTKVMGKDFQDLKIEDIKALFPEMPTGPLVGQMIDSGNPGYKLVSNDEELIAMLKIVYVEDYEMARCVAEALAECDEFLLNEDNKPNTEVLQRVEWIKYLLAIFCSVKGRFADAYKQAATGVLTNAMSEKGWNLLQLPLGKNNNHNGDNQTPNQKRP